MLADHNLTKHRLLPKDNGPHSDKFEDSEKRGQQGSACGLALEDLEQRDGAVLGKEQILEVLDAARDRDVFTCDFQGGAILRSFEYFLGDIP